LYFLTPREVSTDAATLWIFDLNGEANRVRKKQSSAIIAADV